MQRHMHAHILAGDCDLHPMRKLLDIAHWLETMHDAMQIQELMSTATDKVLALHPMEAMLRWPFGLSLASRVDPRATAQADLFCTDMPQSRRDQDATAH